MRRRFRSSARRSSSSRRKVDWETATLGTAGTAPITWNSGDCGASWVRYPANIPDFTFTPPVTNPPDATLVRTLVNVAVATTSIDNTPGIISFGICPYENEDASALINVGPIGPGILPDLFFAGNDWLFTWHAAIPVITTGLGDVLFFNGSNDKLYESRAMRKLPSGTGLLAVFSWNTLDTSTGIVIMSAAAQVRMAIKVP